MATPENIVWQDRQIGTLLGEGDLRDTAAHDLYEYYRTTGHDRDHFVAALIARLCLLHAQKNHKRSVA